MLKGGPNQAGPALLTASGGIARRWSGTINLGSGWPARASAFTAGRGAFRHTPHDVFLRWCRDVLGILTSHNIGYALWNLRGSLGVLDSERADVDYEDWYGHKLDRKLLRLMQEYQGLLLTQQLVQSVDEQSMLCFVDARFQGL
jgi:hypothetical protein